MMPKCHYRQSKRVRAGAPGNPLCALYLLRQFPVCTVQAKTCNNVFIKRLTTFVVLLLPAIGSGAVNAKLRRYPRKLVERREPYGAEKRVRCVLGVTFAGKFYGRR